MNLPSDLMAILDRARESEGRIVFLTGAGISAESGIPTFRGEEGYWVVGSRNYRPTEMATHSAFVEMPKEVWSWYLFRRGVCRGASANSGHEALVRAEAALGDRFLLITQNVDGIHLRAGNSEARTFQIHGNIDYMRSAERDTSELFEIPSSIPVAWPKERRLTDDEFETLRCPNGERARPHVLWFDESYDEEKFKFESSLRGAVEADLLIVIGTSGATNLPVQVGQLAAQRGAGLVAVNPEPSIFTELASRSPHGFFAEGTAGEFVPAIVDALTA